MSAAVLFACPAIAQAQGGYANPIPANLNGLQIEDTTNIGIEDGEPLTPPSNSGDGTCTPFGTNAHMADTIWFKFTAPSGSAHPISLDTEGSSYDTQLAVYSGPAPGSVSRFLACSNDLGSSPFGGLFLTPVPGNTYLVQVGGCDDDDSGTCPSQPPWGRSGDAWFAALTNDDRSNPETINPGRATKTNVGASTDGTEPTSCGGAQYGKTVWFRYTAPAEGDVTYATTVVDTVLSAYRGSTRLRCNDDAGDANAAEIGFHVDKGQTYLIQVGGKVDGTFTNFGGFTHDLKFTEDRDHDNDGYNRPPGPDCNDNNAGIHPNAPSVTGNGVDENCDGSDPPAPQPAVDTDGDGSPAGQDCDDGNKARRPGNTEIRGNKVDEDCSGKAQDYLQVRGRIGRANYSAGASTRLRELFVRRLAAGERVTITCRGRGCGRERLTKKFNKARASFNFASSLRRNRPRKGAVLEVRITAPRRIGRVYRYTFRFYKFPKRADLCLRPGANKPTRCP